EKISEAQVRSQIDALNRDFRRRFRSRGYSGMGVDMQMEFCLATKDPNGNPTNGIVYVQNANLTIHERDTEESTLKSTSVWNQQRYLNFWIVQNIVTSGGNTVLGYARFPTSLNNPLDGIVIRSDCWGTMGTAGGPGGDNNLGRTATHEVGHWLNLFHTFEGGCGTGNCTTSGDRVCDTPPTYQNNFGGPGRQNTCDNDTPDLPDYTRNYMDYADDAYADYFSQGQKNRAIAALTNIGNPQRINIHTDATNQLTGTGRYTLPKAAFSAQKLYGCPNQPIQLYDYSTNFPTSWNWTIRGGNPQITITSTDQHPIITLPNKGKYTVILRVTNQTGTSPADSIIDYITITDTTFNLPYFEGFDASNNIPSTWTIDNQDATTGSEGKTWRISALASGFGQSTRAARMDCNTYKIYGAKDGLISPRINCQTSGSSPLRLTFSVAYGALQYENSTANPPSYPLLYTDTLSVYVTTDCGYTRTRVYHKGGEDLRTIPNSATDLFYQPAANEWRSETVNLNAFAGQTIQLIFETTNGFGNHILLDDISLTDMLTSLSPEQLKKEIRIATNPVSSEIILLSDSPQPRFCNFTLHSVDGKLIWAKEHFFESGSTEFRIPVEQLCQGMYLLQIHSEGITASHKILKR
ncbi:MAG: M43 family zinc metalloprotease, partial [Bacteroidia bacterium]|nr:M43 family zinc metalloprotease [Bacteroidia bacterium]